MSVNLVCHLANIISPVLLFVVFRRRLHLTITTEMHRVSRLMTSQTESITTFRPHSRLVVVWPNAQAYTDSDRHFWEQEQPIVTF